MMFTSRRKSRQCHEHQNTVFNIIHSPGRQLRDFLSQPGPELILAGAFSFLLPPANEVRDKVMFSQVSVCRGGGVTAACFGAGGWCASGSGVVCVSVSRVCVHTWAHLTGQHPPPRIHTCLDTHPRTPPGHTHTHHGQQGAVHILLECFLILRYGRSILTNLTKRKSKHRKFLPMK